MTQSGGLAKIALPGTMEGRNETGRGKSEQNFTNVWSGWKRFEKMSD